MLMGDTVTVTAHASTCVYGGPSALTSFSGLLVFPCGFNAKMGSSTFNAAYTY
jgi:hypothetical protein